MESFDQVWESSRTNSWSWICPFVLWMGVSILFALSLIRNTSLRWAAKIITIFGVAFITTIFSAREIQEKWRIRGEWAEAHADQMSPVEQEALTIDGANLTFGPFLFGCRALVLLVFVAIGLSFVQSAVLRLIKHRNANPYGG